MHGQQNIKTELEVGTGQYDYSVKVMMVIRLHPRYECNTVCVEIPV